MHIALRRTRGILGSMAIWSVLWALLGAAIGAAVNLGAAGVVVFQTSPDWPLPILFGTVGLIVGAINGLVFAGLLMLAERNRRISEMRATRVGLWAALASAATTYLLFSEPMFAAVAGVLGFVGGALALRVASRGETNTEGE